MAAIENSTQICSSMAAAIEKGRNRRGNSHSSSTAAIFYCGGLNAAIAAAKGGPTSQNFAAIEALLYDANFLALLKKLGFFQDGFLSKL